MAFLLTPEETFLWDVANHWRTPKDISIPTTLDWARIAEIGIPNRMGTLLRRVLAELGHWESLPERPRAKLDASAGRLQASADRMSVSLAEYLRRADARGVETVVLKGLAISTNVYGEQAMRPGGDIDILVRREHVPRCIEILDEMGIGAYWPNLMADPYYERHHLHQQRSSKDLKIWYEIHWALDHPYTLLTIDYSELLNRTRRGELLGQPVNELALPDLLLSLSVHLVKHAIYLPDAYSRPDIARGVLADGMLMYYLDIAELIKHHEEKVDWDAFVELARETGAVDIFGSVLQVCRRLLNAPVPDDLVGALPVRGGGSVTRLMMHQLIERKMAQYLGMSRENLPGRIWSAIVNPNGAFILRPIRLLESSQYFFPTSDYLRRKYGENSLLTGAKHFIRAIGEFVRFGWDSLYFAVERYRRLKDIGYSTSLFNRLETEG